MAGIPCSATECQYSTDSQVPPETDLPTKLTLLQIHRETVHPTPVTPQAAPTHHSTPRVKLDPPKLSAGSDQETWGLFLRSWELYKSGMNIKDTQASVYLFNCLDQDLREDILRANPSTVISDMSELDLIAAVKLLAVKVESKLVHRIRMGQVTQASGQSIRNFHASLKGQAKLCLFKASCPDCQTIVDYSEEVILDQLVRGINDKEILADLLGETKTDMPLQDVVEYIARKEQAKTEQSTVSCEQTNSVQQSPGKSFSCWACQGKSHGPNTIRTRQEKCPAWSSTCDKCKGKGHYSAACSKCSQCGCWGHKSNRSKKCSQTKREPEQQVSAMHASLCATFIGSELEGIFSLNDMSLAVVGNKKGRVIPLTHQIFDRDRGWLAKPSAPHPTILVTATPCPHDHSEFGHTVANAADLKLVQLSPVCADTGCQSTCVPPRYAYQAGYKRKDFIPVASKMNGAGRSDLGVLGAVVLEFSCTDGNGVTYVTRQLCYVCDRIDRVYLSRQALADLCCISPQFPTPQSLVPAQTTYSSATVNSDSPCTCPTRPASPPPLPTALPPGIDIDQADSVDRLKEWLLEYYKSTTFNTCDHQQLPLMTGSPLQLHMDPQATPVACHKVVPVPLHWREQVKNDLERDVRIGVLEKVPDNTPVTWQSRMVITAKADGTPRRTIDLQPLNKHSIRQTFPVDSPFNLASRVPAGTKKSVCDVWNGYHSVKLHPAHRHYTTFLTPWGRFRYKVAPQGHMVSGDGFNERYSSITSPIKNVERCVDDSVLWTDDIQKSFTQVCEYLDLCARNGVILNPKKFQFCQDVVNFAGLQITETNVRPSEKLLKSIREFPTPRDITGARAWFGLVNQAAYAFAMTEEMACFRHLLKPKVLFEWTEELDRQFIKSKEAIVGKIIEGVHLFDPTLTTCLATDFSGTGLGFFLLQKTCSCTSRLPTCCQTGWRLCLVGSRFLHPAETRYAPIEGEALAVAYALHQCRYFILGCTDLIVATDHKPLVHVLNDRSLSDIQNRRLQNLKEKTLSYRFQIVHVPGKKHLGPDAASRFPVGHPTRLLLPGEPIETDFGDAPPISELRTMILEGLETEFGDAPLTTELRAMILEGLATEEEDDNDTENCLQYEASTALMELNSIAAGNTAHQDYHAKQSINVVSWAAVRAATAADPTLQSVLQMLTTGFPVDSRTLPANIRPYFPYASSLYELNGVLMLSDRIVIPTSLRPDILNLLHAAHQGIDRMKARAGDAVFWPGIVGDISRIRWACTDCHRMAKSHPQAPPQPPNDPEYPFQQLAADYFHYHSKCYLVIVDRYSHWPMVYRAENGSSGLVKLLRQVFSSFGVAEEIASDGGKEFTAGVTQIFLKNWSVHHRLSSVAFPHSNCRAELAVKQVKRIITSNISPSGSLDVDSFHRAILSYRNTIDPVTKFSPALAVFGRQMRDGLPVLPGKYNPHITWRELLEHREKAMAQRHVAHHEAWSEHTKKLPALPVGSKVFIQNQVGNNPRRWERTGTVMEVKDYDQYNVKVDGTGRLTLRNRRFLRSFSPIVRTPPTNLTTPTPTNLTTPPLPGTSVTTTTPQVPVYYPTEPAQECSEPTQECSEPTQECYPPQSPSCSTQQLYMEVADEQPLSPTPASLPSPVVTADPEPPSTPPAPGTPPRTSPAPRSQRIRRPNSLFHGDTWDLSSLVEYSPTLTSKQVAEMFRLLAIKLEG